ncbi:MAG: LysE family translocator [Aquincola sp.]|nr:LysE family translocator [Aquincola sp.]MDH5329004.1 LysE family translocator [Aquincola sp.]
MLGTHDLALFALTVLVVNATPGVDMAFTLVSTLRGGVRAGLAAAAGIGAGCGVHTLAAAFGLAALMAASAAAFTTVKWAGAAYLLWLAVGMLRAGLAAPATAPRAPPPSTAMRAGALFRQGFVTNVLNPKVALFFLALLPQVIDADAPHKTAAFLFLGAWFIAQGFVFLALFVVLVAPLRRWQPRPAVTRGLHLAGAGLFALLAARLAFVERA